MSENKTAKHNQSVADKLGKFLASSYVLYTKTQNYHWNVVGEHFASLHALFETQYTELAAAIDEIAERIRALGFPAPAGLGQFLALSSVKEQDKLPASAGKMVADLLEGHEICAKEAKNVLKAAEEVGDDVSVDLMVERIAAHDKTAWMLRSFLEK